MDRPRKISPSPASVPSVHERIAAAEKALLQGATERVIVSDSDLETIAGLITDTGSTKAQILKKAVHLGLQVLKMGSPVEATTAIQEEPFTIPFENYKTGSELGGWKKLDPIPYSGFIPTEVASHYTKAIDPTEPDVNADRNDVSPEDRP